MRTLVWFRRDLRASDNTALSEAARSSPKGVVGVFVICPEEWRLHDDAPVKVEFWLRNLRELSRVLEGLRIPLKIVQATTRRDIARLLLEAAKAAACDRLFYNHEYEVNEQARDQSVVKHLTKAGVECRGFHDHVVFDPATIRTGEGRFYTVYTPFKKSWIKRAEQDKVEVLPVPKKQEATGIAPDAVPERVEGFVSAVDPALWPGGEAHAMKRLSGFCESRLRAYKEQRDTPSIDATSMLSPYLNAGVVSPRQCIVMARDANGGRYDDRAPGHAGGAHWISEVIWREFYQHVLVGFPRVCMHRAFRPATERLVWEQNPEHLQRWKEGRTGVPIVDAAMRQMNTMGWMHNRLRMVAAMYFTKDLFLDWRLGERYFMQTLVDGDLGSNNGGWQWSASTGTDAAPYFRIFNPASQSKRCDPDGEFIRRWVPELRDVEGEAIHEPGALPGLLRQRVEYPEPLVDHDVARERVLRAFKGLDDRAQREA
jgi:deoxyribodipyrimidine photo-lyase